MSDRLCACRFVRAGKGVWSFLRWSSTNWIASVCTTRMGGGGEVRVALHVYPSATLAAPTTHFLISISGGCRSKRGPPAEHMSIKAGCIACRASSRSQFEVC